MVWSKGTSPSSIRPFVASDEEDEHEVAGCCFLGEGKKTSAIFLGEGRRRSKVFLGEGGGLESDEDEDEEEESDRIVRGERPRSLLGIVLEGGRVEGDLIGTAERELDFLSFLLPVNRFLGSFSEGILLPLLSVLGDACVEAGAEL